MASKNKSYGCLLFFVIVFFVVSASTWTLSLIAIYGKLTSTGLGEVMGELLVRIIFGAFGILIAIVLTVIFLILLTVYIVKRLKN